MTDTAEPWYPIPPDEPYGDDDPRDDEQRERDAFSEGRSAYDPDDLRDEGPTGIAAYYSARMT